MRSGLPARSARRSPVGAGSSGTCACRPLHKVGDHVSALLLQPSRQNTPAVFISSLSPHLPQLHLLCFSPCLSSSSPCFMFPHGSYRDLASRCVSSRKIQPPVPGERVPTAGRTAKSTAVPAAIAVGLLQRLWAPRPPGGPACGVLAGAARYSEGRSSAARSASVVGASHLFLAGPKPGPGPWCIEWLLMLVVENGPQWKAAARGRSARAASGI